MDFTLANMMEYIRPELLILVPCMWYLGSILKKNKKLENWAIPFIILIVSTLMSISWFILNLEAAGYVMGQAVWAGICQGAIVAMVTDYTVNLTRQSTTKRTRSIDQT